MATTLTTAGGATCHPEQINGYAATRAAGTIVNTVIAGPAADITLRSLGLRTGSITYLFFVESDAWTCVTMHDSAVVTVADEDRPAVGMSYVVAGNVGIELEDETRDAWLVTIDFQEVPS